MALFSKAVKSASKLRLAITGPSGSGKTYSALAIASALTGGAIAVIDTEHGSASKYADLFSFDVAEMHAPFHPDKFIAALREAEQAGYAVVIIDSISHAWSGTGGVLDVVDEAAKRSKSGNTYMAWKEGTPVQNRLIDAIVQSGLHVIATMRSKTEYVLMDTGNGKQAPRKVGMAPVQRDQFEYEFDVVLDMDADNNAIVSKTRCPALNGRVFAKPGADVAGVLSEWLSGQPSKPAQNVGSTSNHTGDTASAPPSPTTPATGPLGTVAKGDIWQTVYERLDAKAQGRVNRLRTLDKQGGPNESKLHGILVGRIDAICGSDAHRDVLAVLCGREVNKAEPESTAVYGKLYGLIVEEFVVDGKKQANPNYDPDVVSFLKRVWEYCLETRGQAVLIAA